MIDEIILNWNKHIHIDIFRNEVIAMVDVIIVGNGPAGISAALYTLRAGLETLIIGRDEGALAKADKIENYYGFSEPISGSELIKRGIHAAKRLGGKLVSDEVLSIQYNGNFLVKTKLMEVESRGVILATGSARSTPKIEGIKLYEGKGVSYCATCDGFFFRGKNVCVIGEGNYALSEAMELFPIAKSVTILTNGKTPEFTAPSNINVITEKITKISGDDDAVSGVVFANGNSLQADGIFVAVGVAGSSELAKQMGAETNGNKIAVDENMATNVPGLYAAGDCTEGMLQISKAVYDGAKAGTEIIKYIRKNARKQKGAVN